MTTRETGRTGKVVFEVERDEDGDLALVSVDGSNERPLSDVEAAKEEWSNVGAAMFEKEWFESGGKAFRITGKIRYLRHDSIDFGTDYSAEFECDGVERIR